MKKFYLVFGAILLLLLAASHYFGWSFASTEEVVTDPASVRNNPGSYRNHYQTSPHQRSQFFGGK